MNLYTKQLKTSEGLNNQSFLAVHKIRSHEKQELVGTIRAHPDRSIPVWLAFTVQNYGLSPELKRQYDVVSGFERLSS